MTQSNLSIRFLLKRLLSHINPRRRHQLWFLAGLIIITSFMEILSIGSVLPFLAALTEPEYVFKVNSIQPIIQAFSIKTSAQLLLILTIGFIIATFIAGVMRLLLAWASARLCYAIGSDISAKVYKLTLYQPYSVHCNRNSSEMINSITNKTGIAIHTINAAVNISTSLVMCLSIMIIMLAASPMIVISIFILFGLIYGAIIYLTRNQLLEYSHMIALESTRAIKVLQEGLSGIRDIIIDRNQSLFCKIYRDADNSVRISQAKAAFLSVSPRNLMETLSIIIIVVLAYILNQQDSSGVVKSLPIIALIVLASQRLLPVFQQIYTSWSYIQTARVSLHDIIKLLDQPLPIFADKLATKPLIFKRNITLNRIGFRYSPKLPFVLKQVNLSIAKGSRVGFIGPTGSGKSTLLDIIMCLLEPTAGVLKIDGEVINLDNQSNWQMHIAHVPQTVFLADCSIIENIAFGIPKDQINLRRVKEAAKKAQIDKDIQKMPEKYKTIIGERGVRLSGGQCQRIGIARALYKNADVLIFDEASSALDSKTEQDMVKAIESLSKELTVLVVAHRITSLKNCTQIFEHSNGSIKYIGNYKNMLDLSKKC